MNTRHDVCFAAFALVMAACAPAPAPEVAYDPASLRFSGARAFEIETALVTQFPDRVSGRPNNRAAVEWLLGEFTRLGWTCRMDEWTVINYSRPVPLNNVVCVLPGQSSREILVTAHHDTAPTTSQGADNDASGVAIQLHLAEVFAAEAPLPYTLAFVVSDAEEYGNLGMRRYIQTHPDVDNLIAGLSLDNLGRPYYDGMNLEMIGQFRRYGPIWLALAARQAARASGDRWPVHLVAPFDQITNQAAPVNFMDQGPVVAAGVPALGFAAHVPPEMADEHYRLWHSPDDSIENQSPEALDHSGRIAEALIRQLQGMQTFPEESGPYLYFDDSAQVLRGLPLWLIFIGFTGLFVAGSLAVGGAVPGRLRAWGAAMPHFLGLWLPLVASLLGLYALVAVGLMDRYAAYPATTKDPAMLNPRWPAVILFLLGLVVFFWMGRRLAGRYASSRPAPSFAAVKSLSLLVIGLAAVYVLLINPFSLFFFIPLLFWFLIQGRPGWGRAPEIVLFALGGLVVYALLYVFGFVILRYNFVFLWYLLNMFSIGMISFPTAAMIMAIVAAGLALVTRPPGAVEAAVPARPPGLSDPVFR
jgi:hypothetical protein